MKKIGAWPESKWVRVSERFPAKPLLIIFFALVMLFAFSADAEALMIKLEIDELADQSDLVIVGTVQSIESNWNDNRTAIYSTVTMTVEIVLDGEKQQDTVTVVVPGGEVDGIREIVLTSPVFEIGDQVLLFLSETSAKNFSIGSSQVTQYELSGNFQGRIPVQSKAVAGIPLDQLADDFSLLRQGKIVREDLHYINKPDGTVLTTLNSGEQFELLGYQWPGDFPEIEFKINAPSDVSAEIRDAAETWNSAGANFSFVYAGTHSREGSAEYNGINEIIWTELDASSLAIARIWSAGSQIRETDMVFNTNYNWSTSDQAISDHYDVQTVTLHELGHWLGLAHPELTESVMYYRYQGIARQLYAVDVAGIKYLYGEASEIQEEEEPVAEFIVNTSLNPDEGGKVNGSGTYEEGSEVEVNVEVFNGFDFVNWTENGKEVSTNPAYRFTVEKDRVLVANFAQEKSEENEDEDNEEENSDESAEQEQGQVTSHIYWQNIATGALEVWFMSGTEKIETQAINASMNNAAWQVAAVRDMNGNGSADIIWENLDSGARRVWIMNGLNRVSEVPLGQGFSNVNFRIADVYDVSTNGKPDVIWQNIVFGGRNIWFMDGTDRVDGKRFAANNANWQIAAVHDMNGNGNAEIIWEHVDGRRNYWSVNEQAEQVSGGNFYRDTDGWKIAVAGDIDGDGYADIIVEHPNGTRAVWLMQGLDTHLDTVEIGNRDSSWRIVGCSN